MDAKKTMQTPVIMKTFGKTRASCKIASYGRELSPEVNTGVLNVKYLAFEEIGGGSATSF
jgi:hypothetical protein